MERACNLFPSREGRGATTATYPHPKIRFYSALKYSPYSILRNRPATKLLRKAYDDFCCMLQCKVQPRNKAEIRQDLRKPSHVTRPRKPLWKRVQAKRTIPNIFSRRNPTPLMISSKCLAQAMRSSSRSCAVCTLAKLEYLGRRLVTMNSVQSFSRSIVTSSR